MDKIRWALQSAYAGFPVPREIIQILRIPDDYDADEEEQGKKDGDFEHVKNAPTQGAIYNPDHHLFLACFLEHSLALLCGEHIEINLINESISKYLHMRWDENHGLEEGVPKLKKKLLTDHVVIY